LLSLGLPVKIFHLWIYCILPVNILYFNHSNLLNFSSLPFFPIPYCRSFQCILLCLVPTQMRCVSLLLTLMHSFLSLLPYSPLIVPLLGLCSICVCVYTYIYIYDDACVYIWIYLHHMRENVTICLSEQGLVYIAWFFPVPSIYLWMTKFHSSLWLSNIPLWIYVCIYVCVFTYIYISHIYMIYIYDIYITYIYISYIYMIYISHIYMIYIYITFS
jgi:hypothetical protein